MAKITKKISIQEMQLSLTNPRFTFLENFNQDLVEFIKRENDGEYNETKAAARLLSYEGDLKDLKGLISSIIKLGFEDLGESILAVESTAGRYIIAEGNRRALVLKLLSGLVSLPEADAIRTGNDNVQDDNHESDGDFDSNYKWIKNKLDEFLENKTPIKKIDNGMVEVSVIEDSKELWRLIYTKHIVGERPGMRKWSRGKYFVDILNFFPNGIDLDDEETNAVLAMNIQRDPSTVAKDYFEAQFVRDVFLSPGHTIESAYSKMMNSRVSALQSSFSLKNIRETAKKEMNISKENFAKLFRISRSNNGIIKYTGTLKRNDILSLIFDFFSNKTLTTRAIKAEKYENFAKRVRMVFSDSYFDVDKEITESDAVKIDAFNLNSREIEKVLAASPDLKTETKERFHISKSIMENDKKIKKELEDTFSTQFTQDDPGFVFSTLKDQLIHNTSPREFLNAAALSLRALHEQIVVWGAYFVHDVLIQRYSGQNLEMARESLASELATGNVGHIFGDLHAKAKTPLAAMEIINGFAGEEITDHQYKDALIRLKNKTVNDGIHASHRVYNAKNYNDFLKGIKSFQDDIFLILDILKEENIVELSNKIKSKL